MMRFLLCLLMLSVAGCATKADIAMGHAGEQLERCARQIKRDGYPVAVELVGEVNQAVTCRKEAPDERLRDLQR